MKKYDSVYFIGIGGIGMSALARWFNANGFFVAGYDRTPTALTDQLQAEGLVIHFDDSIDLVPAEVIEAKNCLVIYTPAIPKTHTELNYFLSKQIPVYKRSQILGMIAEDFKTIAVAGTHGKTTTSSIIAHVLKHAGKDIVAFLGGIATNYDSNFILNEHYSSDTLAVIEADEFDRSFLTLHPDIAVVTSADADHLDIYGDKDSLQQSFRAFIGQIKDNGQLFIAEKIADEFADTHSKKKTCVYGLSRGQFFASDIQTRDGFFVFNYCDEYHTIEGIRLGVPGYHNVENTTAAIAVALQLGLSAESVKEAVESYRGVKRRFEYVIKSEKLVFIDDYAHHPVEVEVFLRSVKALFPKRKVTAIFQPHLYTRTKDFAKGFATSLGLADEVILLDIYPAREEPIEGVTSEIIFKDIQAEKTLMSYDELISRLGDFDFEVVATIGAGDIDKLVEPIKKHLEQSHYAG